MIQFMISSFYKKNSVFIKKILLLTTSIAAMCTVFFSCASAKTAEPSLNPVYVTNTKKINLLPPKDMSGEIDSMQLLNGKFGKESFSLLAYIHADQNEIFLSLLNDFGTDMGNLVYDGISAEFDSAVFPSALKAEYIIADIQYAFYDTQKIAENLGKSKLGFAVISGGDGTEIRRITNGTKLIAEIEKKNGSVRITNFLRGYEYNLLEGE